MIQRIQSVYLALAILSVALMFAFRISFAETTAGLAEITVYGATLNGEPLSMTWFILPPYVYNILIILILATSLVLFKNRRRQLLLGRLSYLLILAYFVVLYFAGDALAGEVGAENPSYGAGTYFPIIALTFTFLANRAIKKDDDLVRSLDRLR